MGTKTACSVMRGITIRAGTLEDWRRLAAFHYRSEQVGAATRVWVAMYSPEYQVLSPESAAGGPSVTQHSALRTQHCVLAAVLVEALPALACRLRDLATGGAYAAAGGVRDRSLRAARLNRDFRCLARVVVHPVFRGAGVAVRLVRWALDHAETPYVEALAAMGRVNPFFAAAGMTAYDRPTDEGRVRLLAALATIGLVPGDLCSAAIWRTQFAAATAQERALIRREIERFAGRGSGHREHRGHRDTAVDELEELIAAARTRMLSQPVYYLWRGQGSGARGQ